MPVVLLVLVSSKEERGRRERRGEQDKRREQRKGEEKRREEKRGMNRRGEIKRRRGASWGEQRGEA